MIAKQSLPIFVIVALSGCTEGGDLFSPLGSSAAPPATAAPPARVRRSSPAPTRTAAAEPPPEPVAPADEPVLIARADPPETATLPGTDPVDVAVEPVETAAVSETAPQPAGDGRLGSTTVSADATLVGFQFKTPLVDAPRTGRVVYSPADGGEAQSIAVQLLPSGGPAGGGSQMSINAMNFLGAPLTGLPEMVVYDN